jgi:hypothetical protein
MCDDIMDALESYSTDYGSYGSTSEGLRGYDAWKTTEPWDIDDVYLTPERERFLIKRARQLRGELPPDEETNKPKSLTTDTEKGE